MPSQRLALQPMLIATATNEAASTMALVANTVARTLAQAKIRDTSTTDRLAAKAARGVRITIPSQGKVQQQADLRMGRRAVFECRPDRPSIAVLQTNWNPTTQL
jgi:hypothetical protein